MLLGNLSPTCSVSYPPGGWKTVFSLSDVWNFSAAVLCDATMEPGGRDSLDLPVLGCAYVTLSDKAFEVRSRNSADDALQQRWNQQHIALALKLPTDGSGKAHWHCLWAAKQVHDVAGGGCLFRSYEDVYLDRLPRARRSRPGTPISPTKHRKPRPKVSNGS
ncbi:hypothetical protein NMY22_g6464 [Coprinellus aureogranulatus]|nr:hypothetical protein NMY22_g6464 [Coprinellus aureogranulatus]